MLISLHIENIAVIKCADMDFSAGFTALTGETGAGKSILIDSIGFLLGARSNRELLRTGEDRAYVSAVFGGFTEADLAFFAENEVTPDEDGTLTLSRTMSADGHTQSKINGHTVGAFTVRAIAPRLVNIHGQNDSLRLLEDENHLRFLDAYAHPDTERAAYAACYRELTAARDALAQIRQTCAERGEREERLTHTVKTLSAAKIRIGEEEKLRADRRIAANAEKIGKQTSLVYRALKDAERGSAVYLLDRSAAALSALADTLPEAAALAEKLTGFRYEIEDIAETVRAFTGDFSEDPASALEVIENRLALLEKLQKRYQTDEAGLLSLLEQSREELKSLTNSEDMLAKAQARYQNALATAKSAAAVLSEKRKEAAKVLAPSVCRELEFLDMPKVVFTVSVESTDTLDASGADRVTFLISANAGETPKPISRIASGGELARIMLAIKTVFADAFGMHTVIYDEVDTGVSGKTARKIGMKLKMTAKGAQTICVTHSAQIASLADTHMLIRKDVVGDRTETSVTPIDGEARVSEIARILGGVTVSENMRVSARELIAEGEQL